jgi:CHAT domain-containing protein
VAPSLTLSGDAAQPVPGAAPILAVGDPLPQAPDFPRLPNAALEIDDLVRRFGKQTTVLRGQEATPEAYRALDLAQYSMIHFAAHAVASEVSPLDSNIILSPGSRGARLSVRDVRLQSLTASLVTVSSCRGAGVRAYFGEGLIGFAWGFLGAGARQVIAGQWDVPDASTAELMKALYAALAEGLEPAAALRQAQQQIVSQPEPPAPYYWAGFQVYEGPGARAAASPPATTRLTKAL